MVPVDRTRLQGKAIERSPLPPGPLGIPSAAQIDVAQRLAVTGQELREPTILRSPVVLELKATKLHTPWVGGYFYTRGYGSIPGPTIRARPGETLQIKLRNKLGPGPGYESCYFAHTDLGFVMNPATICALNHTNIHTHGLHVSPKHFGDNILQSVKPGDEMILNLKLPENHMGGTHWYHPHLHHATAAQAGGGAHGALIVDDPPGSLPKYVEEMPEKLLFVSLVNIAKSLRLEAWGLGKPSLQTQAQQLWRNPLYPNWHWSFLSGLVQEHGAAVDIDTGLNPELLVNGQWRPKVTVQEGRWYRFRFAFASIEQRVEIFPAAQVFPGASCQYQLLAKDGVYLHTAPRLIQKIYLASGSRADVAISCTCTGLAGRPCHARLNFTTKWEPMGFSAKGIPMEETSGEMLRIETGGGGQPLPWGVRGNRLVLPSFSVRRPCYLVDLRQVSVRPANRHRVTLPWFYPMQVNFDGKGQVWGGGVPSHLARLPVGDVQEWHVSGIHYHPFHLHVNHYQIVQIGTDPYYMVGDWHDTVLPVGSNFAVIRFNVDNFAGKMIAHCHLLEHEDNGMMAYFDLVGKDGSHWPGARTADPRCYQGTFPGPVESDSLLEWR